MDGILDMHGSEKQIFSLPNELIIELLQYLDKQVDVWNFAEALSVKREDIWDIVEYQTLWTHVVIPPEEKFLKYLGSFTKTLTVDLEGPDRDFRDISEFFLVGIQSNCTALSELSIPEYNFQFLNTHIIASKEFPKMVLELVSTAAILKTDFICEISFEKKR